jgi:hypothetical protein
VTTCGGAGFAFTRRKVVEQVPKQFLEVLADLTGWLKSTGVPSMVIGGVAAAILGRPRLTRDVDALAIMPEDKWADALSAAKRHGIEARVDNPLEFARRTYMLLLRHVKTGVDIDVLLGRLPYQQDAVRRGKFRNINGIRMKVPQVEDMLIMKAIAQRPQDLRDIEGILDVHPEADIERVRQWVREFSIAMTMPDLLAGFEKFLLQHKAQQLKILNAGQEVGSKAKSKRSAKPKSKSRPRRLAK